MHKQRLMVRRRRRWAESGAVMTLDLRQPAADSGQLS